MTGAERLLLALLSPSGAEPRGCESTPLLGLEDAPAPDGSGGTVPGREDAPARDGPVRVPADSEGGASPSRAGDDSPDWDEVLEIATPLLHPWLHHRLAGLPDFGGAPEPIRRRLAGARRASALLHIRRREALRGILAAFEREEVPVLVLKGMALACLVYPEPALRPMLDVDLLVPRDTLGRARRILHGLGFRVPLRHAFRPETGATAMPEASKPMQRPGTRMMVDLHEAADLGSMGSDPDASERLFERARQVDLDGLRARVPGVEDLLVHACVHLSQRHLFDRGLPPLLDMALLVEKLREEIPWEAISRRAGGPGEGRGLLLPLKLSRDLLGAPVPPALFEGRLGDERSLELERLATEQVLRTGKDHVSPGLVELAMQPRARRLTHLLRRLNPWRREDLGLGVGPAGVVRAGAKAAGRLGADLLTRARIYAGAWRRGDLTHANLERAIRLRQGRDRIAEMLCAPRERTKSEPPHA